MHDETMWPKTYEELGVELFPEVPKGFNPLEATQAELTVYGYPQPA
jgi:hypothetical protein